MMGPSWSSTLRGSSSARIGLFFRRSSNTSRRGLALSHGDPTSKMVFWAVTRSGSEVGAKDVTNRSRAERRSSLLSQSAGAKSPHLLHRPAGVYEVGKPGMKPAQYLSTSLTSSIASSLRNSTYCSLTRAQNSILSWSRTLTESPPRPPLHPTPTQHRATRSKSARQR